LTRRAPLPALIAALGALAVAPVAPAAEREPLDIRIFARIPAPGQPEPVAIGPRHRVFVGTNQQGKGDADAPSRVFVYSRRGRPIRAIELEGQNLREEHGIQGLAFDGRRRLHVLDRAARARVVRIDLRTGRQSDYAIFRDVPSCVAAGRKANCSATVGDMPPAPDYAAFGPDGSLYVTDIEQALIWRVPPGGGRPEVWFTDPRLESIFGPNGIQVLRDGRTILFAVTAKGSVTGDPTSGAIFRLPIRDDGAPGELETLWNSRPFDGPDGFAVGRSGKVYVALAGANQLAVLSPQGEELTRVPANPVENLQMEIPFDGPASMAFLGRRLLLSNQTDVLVGSGNPGRWAVFDIFTGERGLPLFRPR
jgi:sugar lactone lactonase YvrE